jgi:thiamine-monophosphate kinase
VSEHDLLRWIRSRRRKRDPKILVDTGDDAAVVRVGRREVLFKTDSVVDGVHFDGARVRPHEIGRKAVMRAVSDLAAMGGRPTFALAAVVVPRKISERYLRGIVRGMERAAAAFGARIVGGDVASHKGPLAITVSLLGETDGRPPVLRGGARAGDALCVTGTLGGSLLGKHLRFTPRVREAMELRRRFELHAMIDLSDGLSVDLGHLCRESGTGAVVVERLLPVSAAARRMARRDGRSPLEHALHDGEDYELLFAVPERQAAAVKLAGRGRIIGRVERRRGVRLERRDGRIVSLPGGGWEHRFGP